MIKFGDSDKPIIGEVYEQMDNMLGQIKDIVEPRDTTLYKYIRAEVVKRWDMLNIPLHALAYVLTPKYYSPSWLSTTAPGGASRRKPHLDPEVLQKYMLALDKLVPDEDEAHMVRKQLSSYTLSTGPFGSMHAIRDRESFSSIEWWNMHGGATPLLQNLALRVLSQVVNTSSAERCWSSYSFIHSVKRNRLSLDRAESLVYVHYNLRLLSHYCDDAKSNKDLIVWDKHPEESNLEDGVLRLEQLEDALIRDDDDRVDMPPPTGPLLPRFHGSTPTTGASASSIPLSQLLEPPFSSLPPLGGSRPVHGGRRRDE